MNLVRNFFRKHISLSLIIYLVLIYIINNSVLLGVELVVRGTSAEVLHLLIILGIITGWILARSKLKNWSALLIAVLLGFLLTVVHIGGIDRALWDLLRSGFINIWRWVFQKIPLDIIELEFLVGVIQTRFQDVIFNLSLWFNDLLTGFYVYNQISTLLSWGFILWGLSFWTAWITRRKDQPIWGVLPAGTLLSVLMTYTLERRILLVFLMGAGLILIGLINHAVKQRDWKAKGIKGAENVKERLAIVIVGFSLYTMIFAGLMPSIKIKAIADPFERLVYGDSESGQTGSDSAVEVGANNSDLYSVERFAGLPRQKLIGSGPELTKRVVMVVKYPTTTFIRSDLPNAARYWRSYSYDRYTGVGWQSSPTIEEKYKPGQAITELQTEDYEIITQEIRLSNAIRGTLYSAGPPITLDQEVLVSWRTIEEEDIYGNSQSVVVDDLFATTMEGIVYQVRSLVPTINDDELRGIEGETPDWISDRYLRLPETVPSRVFNLAEDIVSNQPTAYDQAKAIETFLRSYPYTLELPEPPSDRDVADYFLFDLQTGYCDYYATSMVVLARAVGLPSRVVVGYVGGQYDEQNDQYLVSEADAHSWVEVYFGGKGWIPFEPTAARNRINDEELTLPLPPELEQLPQPTELVENGEFPGWEIGSGFILLLALGAWISNRSDWSRLKQMDSTTLSFEIYKRLFRHSRWLGLGHQRSDTIYEFDKKIKTKLRGLIDNTKKEQRLIGSVNEISQLTEFVIVANYSIRPVETHESATILEIWKNLRTRLRYAIFLSLIRTSRERIFNLGTRLNNDDLITNGAADGKS